MKAKFYLQRPKSPLVRVRFKSKRGEEHYDSTRYFEDNYEVGDILKLEKVGEKRLRIVARNGTILKQKYGEMRREEIKLIDNKCFIPVRSDWTDSTYLFGYYNLVEQKYHMTPFLKFLMSAKENPDMPFFLVLDEMNLSKVEYYFSDVLSCTESRFEKDGELYQERVQLHSGSGLSETDDEYFDLISTSIELPTNLFISGTVNIDETTYMFSPKVLDRANVIELNEVDFKSYITGGSDGLDDFVLTTFPNFSDVELASKQDFQNLKNEAKAFLELIHAALEKYNLHFGYRTINEVSLYIKEHTQVRC